MAIPLPQNMNQKETKSECLSVLAAERSGKREILSPQRGIALARTSARNPLYSHYMAHIRLRDLQ